MSVVDFVGDIDFSTVHFGAVEKLPRDPTKVHVPMYKNASDMSRRNMFNRVSICRDAGVKMMTCPFGIDKPQPDGNHKRLSLFITIDDPSVVESFKRLDEAVVKAATERSQEWFRRKLDEEAVRAKYKPLCGQRPQDEHPHIKIKVKVDCEMATAIHIMDADGRTRKNVGRVHHMQQKFSVAPHVSMSYGLYFTGSMFGVTVQAEEMLVCPSPPKPDDLSHFGSSRPLEVVPAADDGVDVETKRQKEGGDGDVVLQGEDDEFSAM